MEKKPTPRAVALLPVAVFLVLYLVLGIILEYVLKIKMGFYQIPIVVALISQIYWLARMGSMARSASGRLMREKVCQGERPSECAASVWPRPTALKPPRTISPI